jgi:hypothetical protein
MNRPAKPAPNPIEPRRPPGGYSDQEFAAALLRSQRSDPFSVTVRALTLVLVFGLLARAILRFGLSAWLLVLPMVVEFIVIFWVGWWLAHFVIDCPAFRKSAGSTGLTLAWTAVIFAIPLGFAGRNAAGVWHWAQVPYGLAAGWEAVLAAQMHWVILLSLLGLLVSTGIEVQHWRRQRGVFVWTSIMQSGFRLAVVLLLAIIGGLLLAMLGDFILQPLADPSGKPLAWAVFGFLLVAEGLTLILSTLMHRDAQKKSAAG